MRIIQHGTCAVACALLAFAPTDGDGKIYVMTLAGDVLVVKADGGMELIRHIELGEESLGASIAIAEGCLFLRTSGKLYCVGNEKKE
jgi:hypothetical protein